MLTDEGGEVTPSGEQFFHSFGADLSPARRSRRFFCEPCLDWSAAITSEVLSAPRFSVACRNSIGSNAFLGPAPSRSRRAEEPDCRTYFLLNSTTRSSRPPRNAGRIKRRNLSRQRAKAHEWKAVWTQGSILWHPRKFGGFLG